MRTSSKLLRPVVLAVVVLGGLGEFAALQRWRLHAWLHRRAH